MAENDLLVKNQLTPVLEDDQQEVPEAFLKAFQGSLSNLLDQDSPDTQLVEMDIVEGIHNFDYPSSDYQTAKRAWEFIVEAGIDPKAVADGLHYGHDYPRRRVTVTSMFQKRQNENLVGESKATEEALVAYKYCQDHNNSNSLYIDQMQPKQLDTSRLQQSITSRDRGIVLGEKKEVIEATIILPAKVNQIVENSGTPSEYLPNESD